MLCRVDLIEKGKAIQDHGLEACFRRNPIDDVFYAMLKIERMFQKVMYGFRGVLLEGIVNVEITG